EKAWPGSCPRVPGTGHGQSRSVVTGWPLPGSPPGIESVERDTLFASPPHTPPESGPGIWRVRIPSILFRYHFNPVRPLDDHLGAILELADPSPDADLLPRVIRSRIRNSSLAKAFQVRQHDREIGLTGEIAFRVQEHGLLTGAAAGLA